MGVIRGLLSFGKGGLLGAAIGAGAGLLFAPKSGSELQADLDDRLRRAKEAGEAAKADKERELIEKFRLEVADPAALDEAAPPATIPASQAVAAIGLGLNAPGALAAQETALQGTTED